MSLSDELPSLKNDPLLEPIDKQRLANHIHSITKTLTKTDIDSNETKAVERACRSNKTLISLIYLINDFITEYHAYRKPRGITRAQQQKRDKLMRERAKILAKSLNKRKENAITDSQKAVAIVAEELPIGRCMLWWRENYPKFRTKSFWDNLENHITTKHAQSGANEDELANTKQKLQAIKSEWDAHGEFAGDDSQRLLDYYKNCLLDSTLNELIGQMLKQSNLPATIKTYLTLMQQEKKRLARSAIYSMILRLQTAQHFNDIACDDTFMYTWDALQKECELDIQKTGQAPPPRRSMSSPLFLAFYQHINKYLQDHDDDTELKTKFQALNIVRKMRQSVSTNPLVAFIDCSFTTLCKQARKECRQEQNGQSLTHLVTSLESDFDPSSILFKLKTQKAILEAEYDATKNPTSEFSTFYAHILEKYKQIRDLVQEKLEAELSQQHADVFNIIFHPNHNTNKHSDVDYSVAENDQVDNLATNNENAKHFANLYLENDYNNYYEIADIIFALAVRIRAKIAHHMITPAQSKLIHKLLCRVYSSLDSKHKERLGTEIDKLCSFVNDISITDKNVLHYISSLIEAPIFPRGLEIALRRHSKIDNKKWTPPKEINSNTPPDLRRIYLLLDYIENVSLPTLNFSPSLNLDTFNNSSFILSELNEWIANCQTDSKTKKILQEQATALQTIAEEKTLEIIGDVKKLQLYLQNPEENTVDLDKLEKLLARRNEFFKDEQLKSQFDAKITEACAYITERYFIDIINGKMKINNAYFTRLDALLHQDITAHIMQNPDTEKHKEFQVELDQVIKNDYGYSTNLLSILTLILKQTHVIPHPDALNRFANNRLNAILRTNQASQNDYEFFDRYLKLLNPKYGSAGKKHATSEIERSFISAADRATSAINHAFMRSWHPNEACLIELLGNNTAVQKYRLKKLIELFELESTNASDADKSRQFAEFADTINLTRDTTNPFIDPSLQIQNRTFFEFLNDIIETRECSPLLLKLVEFCASPEQLQFFHTKSLTRALRKNTLASPSWASTWLIENIKPLDGIPLKESNPDFKLYQQKMRVFFGDSNIAIILQKIEMTLHTLKRLDEAGANATLSGVNLASMEDTVTAIQPLQFFYLAFSNNKKLCHFFQHIDDFFHKALLCHDMRVALDQYKFLGHLAKVNLKLHNAVLAFIQFVHNSTAGNKKPLTEHNIRYYLNNCNIDILTPILEGTNNLGQPLDIDLLQTLYEQVESLTTKYIRTSILLSAKNRNELESNPYWFQLINNMDQPAVLANIKTCLAHASDENLKNPLFRPDKPTRANIYFHENKPITFDNQPFTNSPLANVEPSILLSNPHWNPQEPMTRNPAYDPLIPLSNANYPFVNSKVMLIEWSDSFKDMLAFAIQVCKLKQRINHLILVNLTNAAGIPNTLLDGQPLSAILDNPALSDGHLLKLWNTAAIRLREAAEKIGATFPLINFFVNILVSISNVMLTRSAKNRELLNKFIQGFGTIADINTNINLRFSKNAPAGHLSRRQSIFESATDINLLTLPLITMTKRTYCLSMIHKLENFVGKKMANPSIPFVKVDKKYLAKFTRFCKTHASEFKKPNAAEEYDLTIIATEMDLQNSKPLRLREIAYAAQLYCKLTATLEKKQNFSTFAEFLLRTTNSAENKLGNALSSELKSLFQELNTAITNQAMIYPRGPIERRVSMPATIPAPTTRAPAAPSRR